MMLKRLVSIFVVAIFAIFTISSAKAFKMQRGIKGCITHVVNSSETLSSILDSYKISYQAVEPYNSSIGKGVVAGQLLYIPKAEIGKTEDASATLPDSLHLTSVDRDKLAEKLEGENTHYVRHIVAHGETIYSISRFYNVSPQQIVDANPTIELSVLSRGMVLRVPSGVVVADVEQIHTNQPDTLPDYRDKVINPKIVARTIEKMYSEPYIPIKVSLILPLESEEKSVKGFIEFYQGFLIGLDSLKNEGVSIDLNVINSSTNLTELSPILSSGKLDDSDIIIGPVYDQQFCAVANYAASRQIPIVSPLGEVSCSYANGFQVAPSPKSKYKKFYNDIKGKKLIYLSTPSDDMEFLDSITSIASDTLTRVEFDLKKGVDYYIEYLSADSSNLFVVAATDNRDLDNVISKIGAVRTMATGYRSSTIASSRAARYATTEPSALFKANVSFPSMYHANRTSEKVLKFDTSYIEQFNTIPSLYSYRGYDIALFFLGSMKEFGSHFYKYIEGYHTTILQVKYRFVKDAPRSSFVNHEWAKVRYLSNYKIVVE